MYLSHLEIVGFKSFANKTLFKFTDGMTAFVGPNGCGKSNIVDAIRWVLGEQKSTALRSDIMENVIFNGAGQRKPLGMAEVSITIQNNKNILPMEFTELTVTRRLFRDGESAYLINNSKCRLKDITDLFMDTGLGPDSYSVIELKMIEGILSGKPEERRRLFEEAAGVTKYKARRKEAARKLAAVQLDLTRVQDIVQEVQKNVNSLSRQAAKTRRYNKLMEQHKDLGLKILIRDYQAVMGELKQAESGIEEINKQKTDIENSIAEKEGYSNKLKEELTALNNKHGEARDKEESLAALQAQKNKDIAVLKEKSAALKKANEKLSKEIEDSDLNKDLLAKAAEEASARIIEIEKNLEESRAAASELGRQRDKTLAGVTELREMANEKNEAVINLQNSVNNLKNEKSRLTAKKEKIEDSQDSGGGEKADIQKQIEELESEKGQAQIDKKIMQERLELQEKELEISREKHKILQAAIEKLQEELSGKKNELSRNSAALDFYKGFVDAGESSKFLIESYEWGLGKEKTMLAEELGVEENYRVAVETALGEAARYFVTDTRESAISAFKLLKENEKGKAAFICRDSVPELPAPEGNINFKGVYGWVSEITRTDDTLRNAVRAITGRALIVESLDAARTAIEIGACEKAATLEGELLTSEGVMKGGSVAETEGLSVGKKERVEELEKSSWELNKTITELAEEYRIAKENFNNIDLLRINQKLRNIESEINSHDQSIARIDFRIENLKSKIETIENEKDKNSRELIDIEEKLAVLSDETESLESRLDLAREERQAALGDTSEAEAGLEEKDRAAKEAEKQLALLDAEYNNLNNEIKRLEGRKKEIENKKSDMAAELEENEIEIGDISEKIEQNEKDSKDLADETAEIKSGREYLSGKVKSKEEEIASFAEELSAARISFNKIVDRLHRRGLGLTELKSQEKNFKIRAKEVFELALDEPPLPEPEEDFNLNEARAELRNIKEKLAGIGNVNFMALEEYDAQNSRLNFYEEQVKDLTESESTLNEAISEINQTAEEKFNQAFSQINENFGMLFNKLFSGEGGAKLQLAEDNPLEANIEIIAKPPNKKPNSIEALSSGEKTLTAIALLFAIYLVKPSPFCILDEVDAPLDDANVDKFLNLIGEFSNNTQFMVVTHNKKTMSSADTLYGITMEEAGLSKVVSVKLNKGQPQT